MAFFSCIDKALVKFFYGYGKTIARKPLIFLLASLVVAIGLGLGVMLIHFETDVLYLFTPDQSQARDDGEVLYDLFPVDYDEFYQSRGKGISDQGANIIIQPNIGSNVLEEEIISEILRFDEGVKNISVLNASNSMLTYMYQNLCAMRLGECLSNPVLQAYMYNAKSVTKVNMTYPFHFLSETSAIFTGASLGDVTFDLGDNSTVTSAGLFALSYHLQSIPELKDLSRAWEGEFIRYAKTFDSDIISVSFIVGHSLEKEIMSLTLTVLPYFTVACVLLASFSVASCLVADWVLSKTTVAIMGLVSATLAIGASAGLLCYVGVPFNIVAASMPFLIIGEFTDLEL